MGKDDANLGDRPVYREVLSPVPFLTRAAAVFGDRTAVIYGKRRYTYREFGERADRLAAALRHEGVEPGDRVAFLCPNTPELLEAHFAVPAAGAILVAMNTRLSGDDVDYILDHSGARMIFVHVDLEHLLGDSTLPRVVIDDTDRRDSPYGRFVSVALREPVTSHELAHDEDVIAINYTSGTTGRQKGVMYTHRGAYLNALGEIIEVGYTSDTVFLWTLPMFHCNGWCNTWAVTAVGGTHVCLRNVDSEEIWRLFDEERVTHYCGAPVVHIGLVNHPSAHRLETPVIVAVAAAPPSPTLLAEMQQLNLWPRHLYGLTETYGPHTICKWQHAWDRLPDAERAERLARQGVSFLDIEPVRVVDENMHDVPADGATVGEVVMRGNNVMKGYWQDPEATADAFRGGWFHSGDMGVMHPDGYLELRDRAKDIIISGGENISTIEVEQAIAAHPAVLECAVVAMPDDRWGERPKGFVTIRPGEQVTEEELIAFCRDRLAHFKCPSAVEFCELPKTSTGKTQKYILREREWSGRSKRIG